MYMTLLRNSALLYPLAQLVCKILQISSSRNNCTKNTILKNKISFVHAQNYSIEYIECDIYI